MAPLFQPCCGHGTCERTGGVPIASDWLALLLLGWDLSLGNKYEHPCFFPKRAQGH